MKRTMTIGLALLICMSVAAAAQENSSPKEETQVESGGRTQEIRMQDVHTWNVSVEISGSRGGGDAMAGIGAQIMREFGEHLEIGFRAHAQGEVAEEYEDGEGKGYHMSSGYGTLVVKPKVRLGERWEIGFPLESGNGLLQYRYNGEYREELRWNEEIIDQVSHSVYSAGIEPKLFVGSQAAVTLAAGYLVTGPLRTDLAEGGELNGFWLRFGYSVGF